MGRGKAKAKAKARPDSPVNFFDSDNDSVEQDQDYTHPTGPPSIIRNIFVAEASAPTVLTYS